MSNLDRLRDAFRTGLMLPADYAVDALEYRGVEQWDSLAHLTLVAEIENAFGVSINTDDVIDLDSFAKAVEILQSHDVDLGI
jgi:hypothetical protein